MKRILFLMSITCALLAACTCGNKQADSTPVDVSASVMFNRDSLLYYAQRAATEGDAKALFITAAASYLRWQGEMPDSLAYMTISRDEADILLMRAAEMDYAPAIDLIHCLQSEGFWDNELSVEK